MTLCFLIDMVLKVLGAALIIFHALAIDSDIFVALHVSNTISTFMLARSFQ